LLSVGDFTRTYMDCQESPVIVFWMFILMPKLP
jgi:hypothetical protein